MDDQQTPELGRPCPEGQGRGLVTLDVYVESGVGGHIDNATQAWVFYLDYWGTCGQGDDEPAALADLARRTRVASLRVVERVVGDELAFERDRMPATRAERARTQEILDACRAETIELIRSATDAELDYDDPERVLPAWATWRTSRQLARHITDTETRYYLASLGVEPPPRAPDLLVELVRSAEHVRGTLPTLPPDLLVDEGGQVWTTTKVLRRLAWHEAGELVVIRRLLAQAQGRSPRTSDPHARPPTNT